MKERIYLTPEMDVTEMQSESIICDSQTNIEVSDPWTGNTEIDW